MALTEDLPALLTRDGRQIGNPDIAVYVTDLFRAARQHRRPIVGKWTRNYNVLQNRTWGTRDQHLPSPEIPEIYPVVATITSWQTDSQPTFECAPYAPPHSDYYSEMAGLAQDMQTVLQANWVLNDSDAEIEKILWDGNTYGIGVGKVTWDARAWGGLGDAVLRRVDPYTWYVDPQARSMEDASYFVEAKVVSAQELEARYPGALAKVRPGTAEAEESPTFLKNTTSPTYPKANPGTIDGSTTPTWGLPGQTNRIDPTSDPGYLLIEAWLKTPVKIGDKWTDTWRLVAVVGNVVLRDVSAYKLWGHGQHPYIRYVPHDTGEFYGFSLVEMLTSAQLSINRLLAAMEQNVWLTGNPILVASMRANLQRGVVTNRPGTQLNPQNADDVKWMEPPQGAPALSSDLVRFYIDQMERISGMSAIVRGATMTGRNAQGVVDSMQEAAFVRIRMSLRNLERFLRRAGNLTASLVAEFYDASRIVPFVGPDGARRSMVLHNQHFYRPSADGTRLPTAFHIKVEAGSMLPTSKQARAAEAQSLYALGAIDVEGLLDAMDYPNRQAIIQRVQAQQMQAGTLGQPPTQRAAARR